MTTTIILVAIGVVLVAAIALVLRKRSGSRQIGFPTLGEMDWSDPVGALSQVFAHVHRDACSAVEWYAAARQPKKWSSLATRSVAIIAVAFGGIFPLVNEAYKLQASALWVSMAVAVAAGAVAFDRFWGASTGWIRYMKTEQKLRDAIERFEFEWELLRVTWAGSTPPAEAITAALAKARDFAVETNAIVQLETDAWIEEFQASLKQLEDAVKARQAAENARVAAEQAKAEAEKPGAANIKVTNAAECDGGWSIAVDDGGELHVSGNTATVDKLPPRITRFKVRGKLKNANHETEAQKSIKVPAGDIVDVEFTL